MTTPPDTRDAELCEQLRQALADLEASRVPPPAAARPNENQSPIPDPVTVGTASADPGAEILRIRDELRRLGC